MQPWWHKRRYGILVQASLSSVPAWAPVGESPTWYRAQLGESVSNTLLHSAPLPETIDHHRRTWPLVGHYDDFVDHLRFDRFDASEWAGFASEAGMGYFVMTAKHYDGWCWWDAPGTDRLLTERGPRRNVLGELRDACADRGLSFGAEYSLLDWGDDRHPSPAYVDDVVHTQLADLVDRYNIMLLSGRGHWGQSGEHWRSDELIERLQSLNPLLVHNDRFWATDPGFRSIDFLTDWYRCNTGWELVRPVGVGSGYNTAVPSERLLTAHQIVALLTEVVARGGHLTLSIGCDGSGRLAPEESHRIREAGDWVQRHQRLINEATPRKEWGDESCRYLDIDHRIAAISTQPARARELRFPHLTPQHCAAVEVVDGSGRRLGFGQDTDGLNVSLPADTPADLAHVVYVSIEPEHAAPISLFADVPPAHTDLASEVADAQPGDVVQLGEGTYKGPVRIPDGVTVRGLGADRTTLVGGSDPAIVLGNKGRLEHCRVIGGRRIAWLPKTSVILDGAECAVLACRVDGHVEVRRSLRPRIASCTVSGIVATDSSEVTVVRSQFTGMDWDCALEINNGHGHLIESNSFADALVAIRLSGTVGATIRNNTVEARWRGVHLGDAESTTVTGNRIGKTMRAVDVEGGTDQRVIGNAVFDGDSGCIAQFGANNVEVTGNHFERLRVGVIAWDAERVEIDQNTQIDLVHTAPIVGPDLATAPDRQATSG